MARSKRPGKHVRVREKPAAEYETGPSEGLNGVLLDSDVIIEILRGNRAILTELLALESRTPTYCTAFSVAEIYAGVRRGEESITDSFFRTCGEVILDSKAGRQAGHYLARYGKSHGLELADSLIAAAATTSGLSLWTLNRRHYPMADLRFYEPS